MLDSCQTAALLAAAEGTAHQQTMRVWFRSFPALFASYATRNFQNYRRRAVVTLGQRVYEELVALTGIERVSVQFSSVQLGLSRCIWVQLVRDGTAKQPYGGLW